MTDKYQQIIDCLETPKLFIELLEHTKVSGRYLHIMLSRLMQSEKITREKVESSSRAKRYKYTRLVDSTTYDEVISMTDYKKVVDMRVEQRNSVTGVLPNARVIKERHVPSEKKQSPRVYVGCSFNQVGW
jgi:DNA-binding HxlR family transcriptional regulator